MRFAVVHPSVHSKDPDAARALQWFRSVGARRMAVLAVLLVVGSKRTQMLNVWSQIRQMFESVVDERRGIERQRDGEMARRRDGAMDKTTVEAKAKDDDELQADGRAAT